MTRSDARSGMLNLYVFNWQKLNLCSLGALFKTKLHTWHLTTFTKSFDKIKYKYKYLKIVLKLPDV